MAVEAVVGKINLAADKPLGPGMIPLQNLVPLLEPVQFLGDAAPEFFRLFDRFAIDALVLFQALDVRLLAEVFRALELSLLVQNRLDVVSSFGRWEASLPWGSSSYFRKRIADSTGRNVECLPGWVRKLIAQGKITLLVLSLDFRNNLQIQPMKVATRNG